MEKPKARNTALYNSGIQMAVSMGIFIFGGHMLDQYRETGRFWTKIGVFLGLFFMGYESWKLIRKLNE